MNSSAKSSLPNGYVVYPQGIATGPALTELTSVNKHTVRNLSHRIKLKGFDYLSHLFYVEGCLYKPILALNKYVKIDLKDSNKELYVNIDSLAKRLMLHKAIIEEAGSKYIETLIEKRSFISSKEFIEFGVFDREFADCFESHKNFKDFLTIYNEFIKNNNTIPNTQLKEYVIKAWKKFRSKSADGTSLINEFLSMGVYDPEFSDSFKHLDSFKRFKAYYDNITTKYDANAAGRLSLKGKPIEVTPLTTTTLKKVIIAAWKKFSTLGTQAIVEIEGKKFIISKSGDQLDIVHEHKYGFVGEGTSGTIDKVLHVTKGVFGALKSHSVALPSEEANMKNEFDDKHTRENAERENAILEMVINEKWAQELLMVINVLNGDIGHVTKLYNENLGNWINDKHTPAERVKCCKQLMQSCMKMWHLRLVHYDLKPGNVFVDKSLGEPVFRIGDFGSARRLDHPQDKLSCGETTPAYTNLEILIELANARRPKAQTSPATQKTAFDAAAQKHDLYSLGVIFYQVLIGNNNRFPYELDKHGRQKQNAVFDRTGLEGYDKVIVNLVESMVTPSKMPDNETAAKAWAAL